MLIALVAAGMVLLAALYFHERRAPEPIVPFSLWRIRTVAVSNLGASCIGVSAFLCDPLSHNVRTGCAGLHQRFWRSGLCGPIDCVERGQSGRGAACWRVLNFSLTAAIGSMSLLVGCIVLAAMDDTSGIAWVTVGAVIVGIGMGLCNTTFVLACQSEVSWQDRGGAVSTNIFMRTIGMAVGAGICGALVNFALSRLAPGALAAVQQLLDPVARTKIDAAQLKEVSVSDRTCATLRLYRGHRVRRRRTGVRVVAAANGTAATSRMTSRPCRQCAHARF